MPVKINTLARYGVVALAGAVIALSATHMRANAQDKAAKALAARAPLTAFRLSSRPPQGAVILFSGKQEEFANNFYKRYTTTPGDWTVDAQGVSSPAKDDLTTKMEFGDCYVHAEFQCSVDANGKSIGEGNSGVAFEGRYEVQILDSYGKEHPDPTDCGAFYSKKAPLVNPSKKPGEWQVFDILFRAPRFDGDGKVTEKARATVFMNGVIVQNNDEIVGPTGIQYGEFKGEVPTGPIILQGDHSPVHFRNVWAVPL
jgi:hypothetical protein